MKTLIIMGLASIATVAAPRAALAQDESQSEGVAAPASEEATAPDAEFPEEGSEASGEARPPTEPVPESRPAVRHLPVHQLRSDEDATFRFEVADPGAFEAVIVRYRPLGAEGPVREAEAARHPGAWAATVAAIDLPTPGIAYWVVARTASGEEPVFASPSAPHPAHLDEPNQVTYERAALERHGGRRSRAAVSGEYVQLGTRAVVESDGTRRNLDEHYYSVEASYSHSFFLVVDEIRFALGRLRGNVVDTDMPAGPQDERGLDYGTATIVWKAHAWVRFRTGVLFGFSHRGFEVGGAGDVVVGDHEGTSLTFGAEGVTTLGVTGRARLGWLTVPKLPMGATVEVTNWPVGDEAGLRLLFDAAYQLYPGAHLRVEAGYRGWNSTTGGVSLGGELALSF